MSNQKGASVLILLVLLVIVGLIVYLLIIQKNIKLPLFSPTSNLQPVVSLKSGYQNPFAQYTNPTQEIYQNPFRQLK